jgi:ssDNA-binding Zn-finger/Zn-ribbon topoisomerase 1
MKNFNKTEKLKELYAVACPVCGFVFYAKPSMSMELRAYNRGHAACPKCKELLRLKINKKGTAMTALEWCKYLEKLEMQKK